jgi:hypothetical protein
MKRIPLLALLSLGLCASSASADSGATAPVKFTPYTFGYVKEGLLGPARPRNRILIAKTKAQALLWDRAIRHNLTTAPQYADFGGEALIGVFLLARRPSPPFPQQPRPLDVEGVAVTSMAVGNGTLFLTLEVSPYSIELCGPGIDSPTECFILPPAPSQRDHAFAIFSVAKAALAHVRRLVVTQEVYDSCPIQVDVPNLPV